MSWHFERFQSLLQGYTWQNHFHCSSQWGIQWHHLLFMAVMQKIKATEIIWGPVVKRLSTPKGHFREKRAICNPGLKRNAHVMQVTASVCFLFPATFCRLQTASPEIRPVFVWWSISFDVHGKLRSCRTSCGALDQLRSRRTSCGALDQIRHLSTICHGIQSIHPKVTETCWIL